MKYFKVHELVPKALYEKEGDQALTHLNSDLLDLLDWIREQLNTPIIVNNWKCGGDFQYRGFREATCQVGALNSWHKKGMAVDFHTNKYTPEEIRSWLKKKENEIPVPIRIEEGVNWVHIDLGNKGSRRVETFRG